MVCSARDASAVFGLAEDDDRATVTEFAARFAPAARLVCLTCSERGSVAIERGGAVIAHPAVAATVVDRFGAGDTFVAGVVDSLLAGLDVADTLAFAARLAALEVHGRGRHVACQPSRRQRPRLRRPASPMTEPAAIKARIEAERLVAIIRTGDLAEAIRIVDQLVDVGVTVVEFSLSGAAALPALRDAVERHGSRLTLGTGTVLDPRDVELSVAAGATFLVAPNVDPAVCREADRLGVLHIPGALTPTEVALALQLGAPIVKLFPAARMGPSYVRDLRGPFPHVQLLATGGVSADNAAEFLAAGCVAVAAGGALTGGDPEAARRLVHATRRPTPNRRVGPRGAPRL